MTTAADDSSAAMFAAALAPLRNYLFPLPCQENDGDTTAVGYVRFLDIVGFQFNGLSEFRCTTVTVSSPDLGPDEDDSKTTGTDRIEETTWLPDCALSWDLLGQLRRHGVRFQLDRLGRQDTFGAARSDEQEEKDSTRPSSVTGAESDGPVRVIAITARRPEALLKFELEFWEPRRVKKRKSTESRKPRRRRAPALTPPLSPPSSAPTVPGSADPVAAVVPSVAEAPLCLLSVADAKRKHYRSTGVWQYELTLAQTIRYFDVPWNTMQQRQLDLMQRYFTLRANQLIPRAAREGKPIVGLQILDACSNKPETQTVRDDDSDDLDALDTGSESESERTVAEQASKALTKGSAADIASDAEDQHSTDDSDSNRRVSQPRAHRRGRSPAGLADMGVVAARKRLEQRAKRRNTSRGSAASSHTASKRVRQSQRSDEPAARFRLGTTSQTDEWEMELDTQDRESDSAGDRSVSSTSGSMSNEFTITDDLMEPNDNMTLSVSLLRVSREPDDSADSVLMTSASTSQFHMSNAFDLPSEDETARIFAAVDTADDMNDDGTSNSWLCRQREAEATGSVLSSSSSSSSSLSASSILATSDPSSEQTNGSTELNHRVTRRRARTIRAVFAQADESAWVWIEIPMESV